MCIRDRYKDTTVGILVLTTRNTLSEVQKPKENNSLLNTKAMYNFLRKEERKRVIAQNHMDVPTYNDFTEYDVLVLSLIHISEPTRHAQIAYAVFCLKKN
ncbi:hypothetical protein JMUB7531_29010 [Staphylococcus aureus]